MKAWITQTAIPLLKRTFKAWTVDDCSRMAASLAYYAVFSIFPLFLVLLSVLGLWLRIRGQNNPEIEQELIGKILAAFNATGSNSDSTKKILTEVLGNVKQQAGSSAPIALVTTLFAASGIFIQLDKSFDLIWDVQPAQGSIFQTIKSTLFDRIKAFSLVLAIGALLISSLIASSILAGLGNYARDLPAGAFGWQIFTYVIAFAINVLVFGLLFYAMPKPKMRVRDVLPAAILTAVLWEIGKIVLSRFLGGNSYTANATIAAFIALLAWIYYASQIIFFGAEFARVYTDWNKERKAKLAPQVALPPPPDLPVIALPDPKATAQQKTAYALGGTILGIVSGMILSVVGVIVAIVQLIRRRS